MNKDNEKHFGLRVDGDILAKFRYVCGYVNRHYKLSKNRKRGNGNDSNRKGHDERGGQILDAAERDGRGTGGTGLRGNRHQLRVRRSG